MSSEGHVCGECNREFGTERGLQTHVGRMHDPLPEEKAIELYIRENLSSSQIAEQVGLSQNVVSRRLGEYGLWEKDPCRYHLEDDQGYPSISKTGVEGIKRVRVHRLVAIAKGYDPHEVFSGEYDVDHINNCKLDNRLENIQLLDKETHGAKHAHQGPKNQFDV